MKEMSVHKTMKLMVLGLAVPVVFSLSGCAVNSQAQKGTLIGSGIGAGLGAIAGQAIGGDTEGTLIGAGIGAALGGLTGNRVGTYMDYQEEELRSAMAVSNAASIQRSQDLLTATFRSEMLFDYDSATLKPGAYAELDRVAQVLNNYPQTRIRIEGHTDSRGAEVYNQSLSERRASAVKTALVQRGVSAHRIQAVGYGESQPISTADAMNRRVVVVITPAA